MNLGPATAALSAWIINADNFRGAAVADELRSIAGHKPDVIAIVEAIGNPLPELDGYVLVRDASTDSRANIAAYIRADVKPSHGRWVDCRFGWPRTEGPGWHEPRSFLTFSVGGRTRVVVAHQPPPRATRRAKVEHLARLARYMNLGAPVWPVLCLWDANGAQKPLARMTKSSIHGWRVDNAVARGVTDVRFRYLSSWPRVDARTTVTFRGDHGHVWRGVFDLPAKYLRRRD